MNSTPHTPEALDEAMEARVDSYVNNLEFRQFLAKYPDQKALKKELRGNPEALLEKGEVFDKGNESILYITENLTSSFPESFGFNEPLEIHEAVKEFIQEQMIANPEFVLKISELQELEKTNQEEVNTLEGELSEFPDIVSMKTELAELQEKKKLFDGAKGINWDGVKEVWNNRGYGLSDEAMLNIVKEGFWAVKNFFSARGELKKSEHAPEGNIKDEARKIDINIGILESQIESVEKLALEKEGTEKVVAEAREALFTTIMTSKLVKEASMKAVNDKLATLINGGDLEGMSEASEILEKIEEYNAKNKDNKAGINVRIDKYKQAIQTGIEAAAAEQLKEIVMSQSTGSQPIDTLIAAVENYGASAELNIEDEKARRAFLITTLKAIEKGLGRSRDARDKKIILNRAIGKLSRKITS